MFAEEQGTSVLSISYLFIYICRAREFIEWHRNLLMVIIWGSFLPPLSANCKLCMVGTQMFLCYITPRGDGESGEKRELSLCLPDPKAGWSVGSGA